MFILYAIVAGLLVGFLLRGRVSRLGELPFHWKPVVFAGLLVQVVIFSDPIAAQIGAAGPLLYVGSTLAVLAAVVRNVALPGLPLIALGAASNLTAILANGGYMPASPEAAAALGKGQPTVYSNSSFVDDAVLAPLTDIFAMPAWMPFANIFSIGDVLIGAGMVWVIVVTMCRRSSSVVGSSGRSLRYGNSNVAP